MILSTRPLLSTKQNPATMRYSGLYPPDLMTRVIERLGPPIYFPLHEEQAQLWEEPIFPQPRVFKESSIILPQMNYGYVYFLIPIASLLLNTFSQA